MAKNVQHFGRVTKSSGQKNEVRLAKEKNMAMNLGSLNEGTSQFARDARIAHSDKMLRIGMFDAEFAKRPSGAVRSNVPARLPTRTNLPARLETGGAGMSASRRLEAMQMGLRRPNVATPRPVLALGPGGSAGVGGGGGDLVRRAAMDVELNKLGSGVDMARLNAMNARIGGEASAAAPSAATRGTRRVSVRKPIKTVADNTAGAAEKTAAQKVVAQKKDTVAKGFEWFGKLGKKTAIGLGIGAAYAAGVVMNRRKEGVRPAGPGRY